MQPRTSQDDPRTRSRTELEQDQTAGQVYFTEDELPDSDRPEDRFPHYDYVLPWLVTITDPIIRVTVELSWSRPASGPRSRPICFFIGIRHGAILSRYCECSKCSNQSEGRIEYILRTLRLASTLTDSVRA